MRKIHILVAAACALPVAACNNSESARSDISTDANMANDAAMNDVLGAGEAGTSAAMPTDAAGFATAAAAGDLYEIESARLAQEKATSAELKSFAQMLQRQHEGSSAQLKTAAASAGVVVTPALDAEKQTMIEELKGLSGAEFDRKFLSQQRMAHQKALMLMQNYQSAGDNDGLKQFAGTAQKLIEGHLDRLNSIPM